MLHRTKQQTSDLELKLLDRLPSEILVIAAEVSVSSGLLIIVEGHKRHKIATKRREKPFNTLQANISRGIALQTIVRASMCVCVSCEPGRWGE